MVGVGIVLGAFVALALDRFNMNDNALAQTLGFLQEIFNLRDIVAVDRTEIGEPHAFKII